jgi:hypothetical protein
MTEIERKRHQIRNVPLTIAERTVFWFLAGRHPWEPFFHRGKWVDVFKELKL